MSGMELLSPAGSLEGVYAAVQNGADAVYAGLGEFNARRGAKNLSAEEFREAAAYCRVRGVKLYAALNTLVSDRELIRAAEYVALISSAGADALIAQDLGVLRMVAQVAPGLPLHASTQMSVHSLEGVLAAEKLGASRVVLARELPKSEIEHICAHSPIEVEVFAHGALCMCYSGQCYMSAMIGARSGNRGLCAQPCRLPYRTADSLEPGFPLSLRDLSLVSRLRELEDAGVRCLKIEGRMKRPEYTAVVTGIFARALRESREPDGAEMEELEAAFSRQGFTEGYFLGEKGPSMFGVRGDAKNPSEEKLFSKARETYARGAETRRVPVAFYAVLQKGKRALLAVEDKNGASASVEGEAVQEARSRPLSEADVKAQLIKTGATPFSASALRIRLDEGASLPLSALNAMRREALRGLLDERRKPPPRYQGKYMPGVTRMNRRDAPELIVSVSRAAQITRELEALSPSRVYVPLEEFCADHARILDITGDKTTLCVTLPRVFWGGETGEVSDMLDLARSLGVGEAVCHNLGHIDAALSRGFLARGGFGLNAYNSQALKELKRMGLSSACLSFELNLAQARDVSKCLDSELIVYGRLPLMITENCIIKDRRGRCSCEKGFELSDRTSAIFPVVREYKCRNAVLNSRKLFLADRQQDYKRLGLWGAQLYFTTENARECVQVTERYLNLGKYEPNGFTRGLYYRGVE